MLDSDLDPDLASDLDPDLDFDVVGDLELAEIFETGDLDEMLNLFVGVPVKSRLFGDLADRFLLARRGPIRSATNRVISRFGLDHDAWYDRIEQVLMIAVARMLRDVATGRLAPTADRWHALGVGRGLRVAREIIDENRSLAVASGMIGYARRRRVIEQVRGDLRQSLGREPDDEEILAEATARQSHLKDASRASMHFTPLDLAVESTPIDIDQLSDLADHVDPTSEDVLGERGAVETANTIIHEIRERHPRPTREELPLLSEVATYWFRQVCLDDDASSAAIAAEFGISERTARRYLAEIRSASAEILTARPTSGIS